MLILWITKLKKEGWKERTKIKIQWEKEKKDKRNTLQELSKKDYTKAKRKKIIPLKKEMNKANSEEKRQAKELINVRKKYQFNSRKSKHIPKKVNMPLEPSNRKNNASILTWKLVKHFSLFLDFASVHSRSFDIFQESHLLFENNRCLIPFNLETLDFHFLLWLSSPFLKPFSQSSNVKRSRCRFSLFNLFKTFIY